MAEIFAGMNERVRLLLNVDSTTLSDALIESYEIGVSAKNYIDSLITKSSLTEEETRIKESCYVYQTCLYILPTLKNNSIKIEQTTHSKIEYASTNNEQIAESIKDRLCQCLIMLDVSFLTAPNNFTISNPESRYDGWYYHI